MQCVKADFPLSMVLAFGGAAVLFDEGGKSWDVILKEHWNWMINVQGLKRLYDACSLQEHHGSATRAKLSWNKDNK